MTTDTLAELAADLEQLASEGPELIHTQSGAYISQKLSEAAKALAAQALPAAGRCDECGKDQSDGWALYCVGCLEKTGLLAKEALPSAQHVSSTAADLTGPNDTAAQATTAAAATGGGVTTGAPSEPFGYFKAQPFGWTDCAETDDGAVALYEQPASQFTGAFSGIAARKLADLEDRGYRVNGYSLMHAETRARGFIDSGGFVGWWSNRDHEQAAQAPAGFAPQPIETAPVGEEALLFATKHRKHWFMGDWGRYNRHNQPRITHWSPLPSEPTALPQPQPQSAQTKGDAA